MSEKRDVDSAVDRVRTSLSGALNTAKSVGEEARQNARKALRDIEERASEYRSKRKLDKALEDVRENVDQALEEADEVSDEAREETQQAIDKLEAQIEEYKQKT